MSTELNYLGLMMVAMRNARLVQEYGEPAGQRTAPRTRKFPVRMRVGNAMIAAGHRLKSVKHASAGAM